VFVRTY